MPERNVDFNITITRPQFYTIVILMLHDACHDFDAGKTDKEFKKLFMKKGIAVKLAKHRTTPKLGGAGVTERNKGFRQGIDSEDSRRERGKTRMKVHKNSRDEALWAKRRPQSQPQSRPQAQQEQAQPGQVLTQRLGEEAKEQLRLDLETGTQSPMRDSLPVSPVRTPPGNQELQPAPEDKEDLEAQVYHHHKIITVSSRTIDGILLIQTRLSG